MSPTKSPTKPTHTHSVFCVGMGAYGAHCVLFAPPHQSPMESSIDSTSWNSIIDSEFESLRLVGNPVPAPWEHGDSRITDGAVGGALGDSEVICMGAQGT